MENKKPRIAILLHGSAGTADKYGTGSKIDASLSYDHFKKHVLDINENVDVFMHSWSEGSKDTLLDLYKPAFHYFEPQVVFDFEYVVGDPNGEGGEINKWRDGKFKGLDNLRFHALFSRWYSARMANQLRLVYEKQHGITYDYIMLTRYDLAYKVDFDFDKLAKDKLYAIGPLSRWPDGNIHHGMHDLWFIASSEKMTNFLEIYNWIKRINHFPHKFTHSHYLALYYLDMLDYSKDLLFIGEGRPWGQGKITEKSGPSPLVRTEYELQESTPDKDMAKERNRIRSISKRTIRW